MAHVTCGRKGNCACDVIKPHFDAGNTPRYYFAPKFEMAAEDTLEAQETRAKFKLIAHVRMLPVIYDKGHPSHYDTIKKNEAWKTITGLLKPSARWIDGNVKARSR